jgi:hypothetical protein
MSFEKSYDLIENRTRNIPVCGLRDLNTGENSYYGILSDRFNNISEKHTAFIFRPEDGTIYFFEIFIPISIITWCHNTEDHNMSDTDLRHFIKSIVRDKIKKYRLIKSL